MEQKTLNSEFFEIGFNDYFKASNNSFERHIVECLVDIYGTDKVQAVYENGGDFQKMIMSYGLRPNTYDNLLNDTNKYEKFKRENNENPEYKSDIASIVEVDIITLFIQKCLIEEPTIEEIGHFENDLLNNFDIIKMHFNFSLNPNRTRDYWNMKKKILSSDVELVEIKPEYLDKVTYSRFGISIESVKKMDYRMVEELNKYIKNKLKEREIPKQEKINLSTAISTGNGFVDALLVISIIVTELSIGAIILFLNM